jgi:pantothenate kinase
MESEIKSIKIYNEDQNKKISKMLGWIHEIVKSHDNKLNQKQNERATYTIEYKINDSLNHTTEIIDTTISIMMNECQRKVNVQKSCKKFKTLII